MSADLRGPNLDDFLPWLNQPCSVAADDLSLSMTLVAARALPGSPRLEGGFELEFIGPHQPVLAQAIVRVSGPDGSVHAMFVVPLARDADATRYTATYF